MKFRLEIEMPKFPDKCFDCSLCYYDYESEECFCSPMGCTSYDGEESVPSWCPLYKYND